MPLGKLSKGQIAKGFEVLDEIEKVLDKNSKAGLNELSSKFYTVIPHDFGRRIPPVINTLEMLRAKMDMLLVSPKHGNDQNSRIVHKIHFKCLLKPEADTMVLRKPL